MHRKLVTDAAEIITGTCIDAGVIDKAEVTDSGYLRAPARITKTGVFVYRNADGSMRRELRCPEEVFAADSLRTLQLVPLTREHPEPLGTPVTMANRRGLDVGVVGSDVRQEGEHVAATVQVEDAAAIGDVQSGKRRELSAGYQRDLELTPGTWNGTPYDGVQRRIRYNHVALTEVGRAGPTARIRLDSSAAVMVCDARDPVPPEQEPPMKPKITVDGVTFEVESESAAQAIQLALKRRDERLAAVDSELATAKKDAETQRGRADAAETERKKLEGVVADSAKPEKIQAAVKARLELERTCKPLLVDAKGQEPDLSGLTDVEIKSKVVLAHDPEVKLDSASAEYLEGRFAGAVRSLAKAGSSSRPGTDPLRAVVNPAPSQQPGSGGTVVDASESRRKLREESGKAWEQPVGPQPAARAQ